MLNARSWRDNPILYSFLSYHRVCNTMGATREAGTAYLSREHEFTLGFSWVRVARSLVFCVVFCRSLFVFWPLFCLSFDWQLLNCQIVSMFALSAVDRGFEPRSCQTKDYKIDLCCFSAKHAALTSKNNDWLLDRNQYNVSEWSDLSICGMLFQWPIIIKNQLRVLF